MRGKPVCSGSEKIRIEWFDVDLPISSSFKIHRLESTGIGISGKFSGRGVSTMRKCSELIVRVREYRDDRAVP
jgi:hypothetical protein